MSSRTIVRLRLLVALGVLAAGASSTACNEKKPSEESKPTATATEGVAATAPTAAPTPTPSAAPKPPAQKVEIAMASVGNEMKFDKTSLTVPTGAEVHLVLTNNAKIETMPHNWVLVKPGTEAKVALDGLNKASKDGYVVPGPDVFAYTPLAPPGKSSEVTFTAPEPGTYAFICTFPGHYLFMKGVMTVTP